MTHFNVPPTEEPTLQQRALMFLVDHYEAYPHTVRINSESTFTFYKIFT